ncbi:MAG: DUF2029 domain-containing protein, partial [Deltaproteobacteria bacterium]|nr:DUF2029 domain-containing protein [Deltaproteobacteria bacterium]
LLVKEVDNSVHIELMIFPFILGALLFTLQQRCLLAACVLGLAVGTKFWPVILAPVILRPFMRRPGRCLMAFLLFSAISIIMFLPFYLSGLDSGSGFTAYRKYWEMNDALFMLFLWGIRFIAKMTNAYGLEPQAMTRAFVAGLLIFWTLGVIRKNRREPEETVRRFLLVVAALFMLSPTQFPWYYLWLVPLLAIRPNIPLLLLTVMLPLYYMRFFLDARQLVHIHDNGIVWLEFIPTWGLLLWDWRQKRKNQQFR